MPPQQATLQDLAARPRIGLPLMLHVPKNANTSVSYSMSRAYYDAIRQAGGMPISLVPGNPEEMKLYVSPDGKTPLSLDAVCLSGGGDLHPSYYGQELHPACQPPDAERDEMEMHLIELLLESQMPVLAICRGMQVLNVALGGSLCQDLEALRPDAQRHDFAKTHPRDYLAHEVEVTAQTRLASILGATTEATNSFHHQVVENLAPGWKAISWTSDGVIEAMEPEQPSDRFLTAVQWHPECLQAHEPHRRLFEVLVSEARAYRRAQGRD